MKITNELLNELGADPKVYSEAEKKLMGESADKIINGELSALLEDCSLPENKLIELKDTYGKNRDSLLENMERFSAMAEELADIFARKSSVFASALTESEKGEMIPKLAGMINRLAELREDTLDIISSIYSGMNELFNLQSVYNQTLADLGMISIAARAAAIFGASYDEDAIMTPILDAYDKLTDLTAFTNDLKDKAVIYEKAVEIKIGNSIHKITECADLLNDGAKLNVSGILGEASTLKQIACDVLHTHV